MSPYSINPLRFTTPLLVGLILIICALTHESEAVKCYDCNSHTDSRCAEKNPPDSMKKSCNELVDGSKYTFCRKIDQQVEFRVYELPEDRRIIRSCGWSEFKYKNDCYVRSGLGGAQTVCSCYGDYCNGAGKEVATMFNVALWSVAMVVIMKKIGAFYL